MKTLQESIIGRKGMEILYIVWPNWSTGVTRLREEKKFEELETQHRNTIFIISESDLINNRHLFDNTTAGGCRILSLGKTGYYFKCHK